MTYKVIRRFQDLTDPKKHTYEVGDVFPRDGYDPLQDFVTGLVTGYNSAGSIFLTVVDDGPEPLKNTEEEAVQEPELPETIEEVPAEKPKRKRTNKKAEA
ncbi:MAG: hypothetical protein DI617_03805 [Streptococcus pyogenes]|nr:MAG: hypothetical protein DI617_03805 [Streptococcus pyogenes]